MTDRERTLAGLRLAQADEVRNDPALSPLTAHAAALLALAHATLVLADAILADAQTRVRLDG